MTQVAATYDSYDMVGMAEDVEDAIFMISPTDTPFLTMAKRKSASATLHQWQTEALTAAAANKQIEGDDATFITAAPTTMLTNYLQIARKAFLVSDTADTVRKYGRARETAHQLVKSGKELKRDIEYALVTNQSSSAGSSTVARASAGLESMIAGNRILCGANNATGTSVGYASGVFTAPTDGTALSAVSEAILVSGIQAAWTDGGDPSVIMLPYAQKARIAGFSGATKYAGTYLQGGKAQAALIGAVDVYISDAGEHKLVLNRYVRSTTILGIDPEYVSTAWLRGIKTVDLAKTGDATKKMLICEFTLVADNPDAHFKIQDCLA